MDSVKEWLTLPEVARVNDPDREEAEVIEELLVRHVFGDSDKPLTPTCKIEAPGVRARLLRDIKGKNHLVVPGLQLRKIQDRLIDPRMKIKSRSERRIMHKRFFSVRFSGFLLITMQADARNSGKTTGMIELNPVRPTPKEAILKGKRHPFVSLLHTLPDGSECRVEPLGSLEVSEKDLLFHLDNVRRFVKGNQAQEKRLEQLISGSSGPEQVTSHNFESVPVKSLAVPLAPPADEVEQGDVEAVGQKDDGQNKGGRPPGYLREAFEHAYTECLECGATEIIKPDKLEEFVLHLKKCTNDKNSDFDEFLATRLAEVRRAAPPGEKPVNKCIKTHDKPLKGRKIEEGRWYSQIDVSKVLSSVRTKRSAKP